MAELKLADLKVVIKEINSLKIKGVSAIRTVGIKREAMEKSFLSAVDVADKEGMEEKLSDKCIDVYNILVDEDNTGGDDKESASAKKTPNKKPADKKPADKKPADKKPADKKPADKKEPAERSCYDHVPGKQTGILDESLREGGTVAEIMEAAGVKRPRVMAHIKYLRDTCSLTILFKENKKGDKTLDHYKVKEQKYRKP